VDNSDLQNLDSLDFFFREFGSGWFARGSSRALSSLRWLCGAEEGVAELSTRTYFGVCAGFAGLSTLMGVGFVVLRCVRLKRSEAYANFAKLSALIRSFTMCNSERFEYT